MCMYCDGFTRSLQVNVLSSLVPRPSPSFLLLAVQSRLTILQVTGRWARAWERGYILSVSGSYMASTTGCNGLKCLELLYIRHIRILAARLQNKCTFRQNLNATWLLDEL